LGYYGTSSNIASTQGVTSGLPLFAGSITIPTAGTYLIMAQTGSQNGGGGTTTAMLYFLNHSSQGSTYTNYGATGTIMALNFPYSNLGTGAITANMSNIVTITASTTYNLYVNVTFTGNCQYNAGVSYINYLRVG
jgi:hypothetical protein